LNTCSFGKSNRLLNAQHYQSVFDHNEFRASHKNILILAKKNSLSQARLGIIVAKKNAKRAVDRNRLKRIIREQFRHNQASLAGIDMIVLSRPGLIGFDNADLSALLNKQLDKIKRQAQKEVSSNNG